MSEAVGEIQVPVIAIDGPGGSGKGTVGRLLADRLGWHFLDSGSLYRLLALAAQNHAISLDNEAALITLAAHLDVQFESSDDGQSTRITLEGEDVTHAIRTESCGNAASKVAVIPAVRDALLQRQRAFREPPGLVADGRDMGSVVFTDSQLKIYLTASAEVRANRRLNQLKEKGLDARIEDLIIEIEQRDERDMNRAVAPLKPMPDSIVIDSSSLGIDQVMEQLLSLVHDRLGLTA